MNTFFSPDNEYIYDLVSNYYDNPTMQFIKNENNSVFYGVQIPSLLMNAKRFLIAIASSSSGQDQRPKSLRNIAWKSFQIRTLSHENSYNFLPMVNYKQKRDPKYSFNLQVQSRDKKITTYETPFAFTVSLLHTKNIEYEYPNEGTFISALETFQTILMLE